MGKLSHFSTNARYSGNIQRVAHAHLKVLQIAALAWAALRLPSTRCTPGAHDQALLQQSRQMPEQHRHVQHACRRRLQLKFCAIARRTDLDRARPMASGNSGIPLKPASSDDVAGDAQASCGSSNPSLLKQPWRLFGLVAGA